MKTNVKQTCLFLLTISLLLTLIQCQGQSIFPELEEGFVISLENTTRIEIDSSNLVYTLELGWNQSYDLLRDQVQPDNEYYIYNFNKIADISLPFLPNTTYNHSEYGKTWTQNLTNAKSETKLPTIPMLITNCSSVMMVDYQDEILWLDREHQTCTKSVTTLLTLQEVTHPNKTLDNQKIARLVRSLSLHWNEKGHIVLIKVPADVIDTVTEHKEIKSIQLKNFTVYHTLDKELNSLFFWVLYTDQRASLEELLEMSRATLPEYFTKSQNSHIVPKDQISFKKDLEEYYKFYSDSLFQVKNKLKILFQSDADLQHKLMHVFDVAELNVLIKKLTLFLDEVHVGSYEIMNFKATVHTRIRILELVEDIEEIIEKKSKEGSWTATVNTSGPWFYRYKFTILSVLGCSLHFYLLVKKRIDERWKKLI